MHSLVSRQDFQLYVIAVKSLLRFGPRVSVYAHSDGTLTRNQIHQLQSHIPGIRIITKQEADMRASKALRNLPSLQRARKWYSSWQRLIDSSIWCDEDYRITCDSDVLFVNQPEEILAWARSPQDTLLVGDGRRLERKELEEQGKKYTTFVQQRFKAMVPRLADSLNWPAVFEDGVTGGFYCGPSRHLNLDRLEQLLIACSAQGMNLNEWGNEQCFVLYLLSTVPNQRMPTETYFNFYPTLRHRLPTASLVHFIGGNRWYRETGKPVETVYVSLARQVIDEIDAASIANGM